MIMVMLLVNKRQRIMTYRIDLSDRSTNLWLRNFILIVRKIMARMIPNTANMEITINRDLLILNGVTFWMV